MRLRDLLRGIEFVGAWIIIDIQLCVPASRPVNVNALENIPDLVCIVGLSAGGKSLVAWRESDDQPQCGGDVHAFHHERGGGAAAMPCEHDGQAGDEADADDGEEDAAARVVRLTPGFDIVVHDVFLSFGGR